jgi:hypothetical protein
MLQHIFVKPFYILHAICLLEEKVALGDLPYLIGGSGN